MKFPSMNRNVVALVVSVVIGTLGAVGLKKFFDVKLQAAQSQGELVSYVVASIDMDTGETISPDNVSKRDVPAKWANSNGVKVDEYGQIDGGVILAPIKKGDVITKQIVDLNKNKQIAQQIPVGRRAITIPVDDESSISAMIKPNDIIDLFVTLQKQERPITLPLMEGVKILATGNILSSNQSAEQYEAASPYTTITLDVSVDDAKNIIMASNSGKITAVLRNPNDQSQGVAHNVLDIIAPISKPVQPVRPVTNFRPTVPIVRSETPKNVGVQVVYGNKNQ